MFGKYNGQSTHYFKNSILPLIYEKNSLTASLFLHLLPSTWFVFPAKLIYNSIFIIQSKFKQQNKILDRYILLGFGSRRLKKAEKKKRNKIMNCKDKCKNKMMNCKNKCTLLQ